MSENVDLSYKELTLLMEERGRKVNELFKQIIFKGVEHRSIEIDIDS